MLDEHQKGDHSCKLYNYTYNKINNDDDDDNKNITNINYSGTACIHLHSVIMFNSATNR